MSNKTHKICTALAILFGATVSSVAVAANNCTTGAKAAAQIWNEYGEVIKPLGCAAGAAGASVLSGGVALPASAATFATCMRRANTADKATKGMIKAWNDLNKNGWGTIGNRDLRMGGSYEGAVPSVATRMWIMSAPVTDPFVRLRVKKRDGGWNNAASTRVTVCAFPPEGPGVDESGEKIWSYEFDSGKDNQGKEIERVFAVPGTLLTVAFKGKSAAKNFKYGLDLERVGHVDHDVVIAGEAKPGATNYELEASGGLVQVQGNFLNGYKATIDDGDRVRSHKAWGRVGGGNDAYAVAGDIERLELEDESAAEVFVDGEPWNESGADHSVVIDGGGGDGATEYRIVAGDRIEQVDGQLAGHTVSVQDHDRVRGDTAEGRVAGGADGFRVYGDIDSIELTEPSAAAVYVDGALHESSSAEKSLPEAAQQWVGTYRGRADGRRARLVVESNRNETALEMKFEDLDRGTELTTRIPGSHWTSGPDHVLDNLVFTGDDNKKRFGQLILHNGGEHIAGYSLWKDNRFGVAFSRDGFEAAAGSGERVSSVEDWSGRYRGFGDGRRVELILDVVGDSLAITWRGLDRDVEFTGEIVMLDEGNAPDHVIESVELTSPDGSSKQIGHLYLHTWDDHYISGNTVWKGKPYGVQFVRVE
ncbi:MULTISPECIES: hypothetical protein [unclassified Wenzhouxiangella]|uniref:hypothetical protein n=1 Tax=unclassified Wenzhouxiangella TaxID=2613841 RepID=UPI000E32D104|nr:MULTISPECIES: hypothetical protein [unclassified Wenzhouxiangella]RFF26721.1 hypothetical protein DZK25_11700 [Wenzhouxiangella sp. 15181]RFP69309.1 hypothetical protein DZK26_04345 [Wenzhouxiangella sp. 15190]